MTPPAALSRLSGLHVALSVQGRQVKARMSLPGTPIPSEARDLIRQIKPHLVQLLAEPAAYKRPGLPSRCKWCRDWEQAGRHRRAVMACSECDDQS